MSSNQLAGSNVFHPNHVLWALGFRPFFLVGAVYSALIVLGWASFFTEWRILAWPQNPVYWHAHEMIYGFATAIVAGFLLTATQNWTGIRGVHGRSLQILVFIWLLARVSVFLPLPGMIWMAGIFSLLFYPMLLIFLKPYLLNKSQRRNWIFSGLLVLLFTGELLFYLEQFRISENTARLGLYLGVYILITMITVIGGRVIPFFTTKAIPSARVSTPKWLDMASLVSVVGLGILHLSLGQTAVFYWSCFAVFALHLARWWTWDFRASLSKPILWILYVGYGWMTLGFLLMGLGAMGRLPFTAALHALTAGAMGVMILGMISRVALGHTARPIQASRFMVLGYILINLSVLLRVFGPIVAEDLYLSSLLVSGILWSLAFILFCIEYIPLLLRPRLDGKPG